jgi:hypothetical protein
VTKAKCKINKDNNSNNKERERKRKRNQASTQANQASESNNEISEYLFRIEGLSHDVFLDFVLAKHLLGRINAHDQVHKILVQKRHSHLMINTGINGGNLSRETCTIE